MYASPFMRKKLEERQRLSDLLNVLLNLVQVFLLLVILARMGARPVADAVGIGLEAVPAVERGLEAAAEAVGP
jgi:hypothetical protein